MWKRRLLWLFLWILSLVGISFYGGPVSYGFFYAVLLIPVLSWVYLLAMFFLFKVYQELESRSLVCGQQMPYYFMLKNENHFAFAGVSVRMFSDFSSVQGIRESTEYQLLPGESYRYGTSLVCKYRGEYEVGIREIVVSDFFRLFSLCYSVPEKIKAQVLPRLVKLQELKSLGELNLIVHREVQGSRNRPDIPVREYAAGDPMKQIHWKSSARMQKLMVREQTGEEKEGISILLVTKRYGREPKEYLPLENKLLELTLALGFFFAKKGIPLSLYFSQNGLQKSRVSSLGDFEEFYQRTAGIVFAEGEEPAQTASLAFGGMAAGSLAFFVVHEMESGYLTLAKRLLLSGTTAFFYVVADEEPRDYLQLRDFSGKIITVAVEADLEEVL